MSNFALIGGSIGFSVYNIYGGRSYMSNLNITVNDETDTHIIKFEGVIDEDVVFTPYDNFSKPNIIVDLEEVKSINSCGIREWIKWFRGLPNESLIFKNCPKVIIDQVNMVEGFVPDQSVVESFYVPYYGEESGVEKNVLFIEGTHYKEGEILVEEVIQDEESGEELEMDVIPKKVL